MPMRALTPCRHPGCGALVADGSGYCESHQSDRKLGKFADRGRGSRHKRGYGSKWDKKRQQILERDGGLCQVCLKRGVVTAAKQVDHIVPKAEGGTDQDENLQAICVPCHRVKTLEEARRARHSVGG